MDFFQRGWATERWLTLAARLALALFLLFWALWFARFVAPGDDAQVPNVDFIVYWTAAKLGVERVNAEGQPLL